MAFETHEPHFVPRQHTRVGGTVGFMAGRAPFESYRFMLEREGTALITVAIEAAGFVGGETLLHRGAYGAVRIVAVDATHGAFGQLVMVGLLELRPYVQVAACALSINRGVAVRHEAHWPVRVNFVAGHTGNLILAVAVLQSPDLSGRVEMAAHADLVGRRHCQLRRIADVRSGRRFRMFLSRPVAGFAGTAHKATVLIRVDLGMRTLLERVEEVLMAGAARGGSGVRRRRRIRC